MELNITKNKINVDLNFLQNKKFPWHIKILQGGGYILQSEQGVYSFNILGTKVINKIISLLKDVMINIQSNEVIFPIVQNASLMKESGRDLKFKNNLGYLNNQQILSSTHEEFASSVFGNNLQIQNLPYSIYGVSHCFRDEVRPKNGLLRSKEFILLDGYVFSETKEQHDVVYCQLRQFLYELFAKFKIDASTAFFQTEFEKEMSEEFIVEYDHIGEKRVLFCSDCGKKYRAGQFDSCVCGGKVLVKKGIEFADIIRNGTFYAEKMSLGFFDKDKKIIPYYMLSFGVGVTKLLAVIVEQSFKSKSFIWPQIISPFDLAIISTDKNNEEIKKFKTKLFSTKDVLVDDRNISTKRSVEEIEMLGIPFLFIFKPKSGDCVFVDRVNSRQVIINYRDVNLDLLKKEISI